MNQHTIRAPFFEIGPKSYLYGQDVVDLAIAADKASEKYGVDIIFTTPIVSISAVKAATKHIHVFAPHMDPLEPGRGLADILPESLAAAGAEGVMLNHVEKPLTLGVLKKTIERAKEVSLTTIVCADSIVEASMIAKLDPDIRGSCQPRRQGGQPRHSGADRCRYFQRTGRLQHHHRRR